MAPSVQTLPPMSQDLRKRLAEVGQRLGEREAAHADAMATAHKNAAALHAAVSAGLDAYRDAVASAGSEHLADISISAPRLDDKHVRAVEFALERGRYKAIVTVKSKGEVTLVGPFRTGKTEGPCKSFPVDATPEIDNALVGFLEEFLEEAATP